MAKRIPGRRADRAKEEARKRRKRKESMVSFAKDILVAVVIVALVMVSLFAYSGGIWPPMVVVESESMMHGDDSQIGIIDTGDLTLVKRIASRSDIVTYVEGRPGFKAEWTDETGFHPDARFKGEQPGLMTYGDYGEVIIYRKNGLPTDKETPVIHRAIVWIEPNEEPDCLASLPHTSVAAANFPDIKDKDHPNGLKCVQNLKIKNVGYRKETIDIDASAILGNAINVKGRPFAGFLTKGDHNPGGNVDQQSLNDGPHGGNRPLAPVKVGWVVGEAVGELPWFGALKLVWSGTTSSSRIPPSSWNGLIITIALIVAIPFALDIISGQLAKRKKRERDKNKEKEDEVGEEEEVPPDEEEEIEDRPPPKRGGRARKSDSEDDLEEDEVLEEADMDLDDEYAAEFEDMKKT